MQDTHVTTTQIQNLDASFLVNTLNELKQSIAELKENNTTQSSDLLTRKQVCKKLNISLVTLHSWINKGILKAYKIGNTTRFKNEEIEEAYKLKYAKHQ